MFLGAKRATEVVSQPQCVACSSFSTSIFWQDEKRAIYRCRKCGLLFRFPIPNPEELHNDFQFDYFKGQDATESRLTSEFETWRRPVLAQITRIIQSVKRGGKLLDVGCASGELFAYLSSDNWKMCGVEPSKVAIERARQRFAKSSHIELRHGYVGDMPAEKSWDVVTVLESLFYMPDPRRELSHISRLLSDDGALIIATPSYQHQRLRHTGLVSRVLYGSQCSLTASHLYYFPRTALSALLQSAGFRIARVVPLGSSSYGSATERALRRGYVAASRFVYILTFGRVNLAPHVLYVCVKNGN